VAEVRDDAVTVSVNYPMPFSDVALAKSPSRWWTVATMSMANFMVMLDNTVVNLALASIQRDLAVGLNSLQWIVSAYTLTFGILLVIGGRLADVYGRRRIFVLGVLTFGASSLALGFAPDAARIIALRAVQGAGAALMAPAMLALISSLFGPHERGKAIGVWAGIAAIGLAVGPVVGGLLTQLCGWRWIFLINVPVAAIAVVLTVLTIRESWDRTKPRRLDLPGLSALGAAVGALLFGIVQSNEWGWFSTRTVGLFFLAASAFFALVAIERHTSTPLIDLSLFASRVFCGVNVAAFAVGFSLLPALFSWGLYLQQVRGYAPFELGMRVLPATALVMVAGPIAGRLVRSLGPTRLMTAGLTLVAGSLVWQSSLGLHSSGVLIMSACGMLGLGIGLVMTPMNTAAMNAVDSAKTAVASGVLSTCRLLGGTLGLAVVVTMYPAGTIAGVNIKSAAGGHTPCLTDNNAHLAAMSHSLRAIASIAMAAALLTGYLMRSRAVPWRRRR
jgi:EmrB/QacA subfamily drug resistance transporter